MKKSLSKTLLCLAFVLTSNYCSAAEDLKPIFPRVGSNNMVEAQMQSVTPKVVKKKPAADILVPYSDADLKKLAKEITDDLNDEYPDVLSDLSVLWQAAANRSETIKFAIYKLSNPDGEKVDNSRVKTILSPIAGVAPILGMGTGNAVAGAGSIFGGGILNSMLSNDSEINHKLTEVTDADLIILAKEIDNLQQNLVSLYYNYITSLQLLKLSDKNVSNRYKMYQKAQNSPQNTLSIADAYYREALDKQYSDRQNVLKARAELEQVVGNDALVQIETQQ